MDGRVSAAMNGPDPETKMQFLYSVRSRGVTDQKVLEAIEEIDRGLFVRGIFAQRAYEDVPLPIACGQTISQPSVVGMEYWGRVWTLTAWCETRQDFRVFRVDLIENAQALPELFVDEPGKRLQDYDPYGS